jgi:L-alanine-DL-glutamate epimerase-like enolase superfamily enzyme
MHQQGSSTPMKITNVEALYLRLPKVEARTDSSQDALIVKVSTDAGLVGWGEVDSCPLVAKAIIEAPMSHTLVTGLRALLVGEDPLEIERLWHKMYQSTLYYGRNGAVIHAMAGIDLALWDLKGKALGQPVWKLLGGAHARLPAYVTFGLPRYSIDELIAVAKMLIDDGHTSLKMVVAKGSNPFDEIHGQPTDADILEDARRVTALREAIGPDIEIMIDANKGPTYVQALKLAKLCEPCNLTWFEDPVLKADPRLMARLRTQTTIPLAAGSTATSDLMFLREYLTQDAVDYLQPNVRDLGGFTQGLKAAAIAQAFNVPLAMGGNYPHVNMHMHAGAPNGGRIEFHWQGWKCVEALFDGAPAPAKGSVTLPTAPGLGFTPKSGILELAVE